MENYDHKSEAKQIRQTKSIDKVTAHMILKNNLTLS